MHNAVYRLYTGHQQEGGCGSVGHFFCTRLLQTKRTARDQIGGKIAGRMGGRMMGRIRGIVAHRGGDIEGAIGDRTGDRIVVHLELVVRLEHGTGQILNPLVGCYRLPPCHQPAKSLPSLGSQQAAHQCSGTHGPLGFSGHQHPVNTSCWWAGPTGPITLPQRAGGGDHNPCHSCWVPCFVHVGGHLPAPGPLLLRGALVLLVPAVLPP